MGNLNLLQSGYTKRVGEVYGVKQYGKYIMKAIPFSHAPHNQTQKDSLTAFTKLNRMSSVLAKNFFNYLPISDKKMYKNNAVAQYFKSMIQGHAFNPELAFPTFERDSNIDITAFVLDEDTKTVSATISDLSTILPGQSEHICAMFVTDSGAVKNIVVRPYSPLHQINFALDQLDFSDYWYIIVKSVITNKTKKVSLQLLKGEAIRVVVNGVFMTNRLASTIDTEVVNDTWRLTSNDIYYENNIIYF